MSKKPINISIIFVFVNVSTVAFFGVINSDLANFMAFGKTNEAEPNVSTEINLHDIETKKFMSDAKTSAARHGIAFEDKTITSNDIVNTITNFAKSNKFDIVIIGARGQSYPKASFLGSISNGILNSCLMPVLVVR